MTTTGPASPDSRRHRIAMWLGHYAPRISLTSYAVMGASFSAANIGDWSTPTEWAVMAPGLAAVAISVTATMCDETVHRRNLCLRDLNRAPLLDPQTEVAKCARLLRFMHSRWVMRLLLGSLAVLFAGIFVSDWMRDHGMPYPAAVMVTGFLTSMSVSAWNVWATDIHRRLQLWCPLCRWGRGPDDDDPQPEDPTGPTVEVKRRTRVTS